MFATMTPEEQKREIARLKYEQLKEEATVRLGIQESLGLASIKGATLVNGGALIALFTFIGNASKDIEFDVRLLWISFIFFTIGLALSIAANFFGYLMQVSFYVATVRQSWDAQRRSLGMEDIEDIALPMRRADRYAVAAIGSAILSLVAFCTGSGFALAGVASLH